MKRIVEKLINNNETISVMESCTGGLLASTITNESSSSKVFKFGAVTYSNEYKIKMGVSEDTILKYSVYSIETAREMSKAIYDFTHSTYSVSITGKINEKDEENMYGSDNIVFVSIYNSKTDEYLSFSIECINDERSKVKEYIVNKVIEKLDLVIK